MIETWEQTEDFLLESATRDLAGGDPVIPVVVAFRDDVPLFLSGLREFDKGEYHHPMIELLALAGALGANRLAAAFSGRAWSLEDPLPPVVDGVGDLRQRVLVMTFVDATQSPTIGRSAIAAYEVDDAEVRWQPPLREDAGEGWISQALTLCAERADLLRDAAAVAREQAHRCVDLGHLLVLHPAAAAELGLEPLPGLRR